LNLGEAKKKALSLIAEYSVDGSIISDSENADYLNRMNRFASDAQMEISDKVGIETSYTIIQAASSESGYNKYPLPDNFKEHLYVNLDDLLFTDYRIQNKNLVISKLYNGTFELFYFKNPAELDPNTEDTYKFELELHAQAPIPYFMGAMAIQDEKPNTASLLLNMYSSKLSSLHKKNIDLPNQVITNYCM
jgi:hypothetical protein